MVQWKMGVSPMLGFLTFRVIFRFHDCRVWRKDDPLQLLNRDFLLTIPSWASVRHVPVTPIDRQQRCTKRRLAQRMALGSPMQLLALRRDVGYIHGIPLSFVVVVVLVLVLVVVSKKVCYLYHLYPNPGILGEVIKFDGCHVFWRVGSTTGLAPPGALHPVGSKIPFCRTPKKRKKGGWVLIDVWGFFVYIIFMRWHAERSVIFIMLAIWN